MRMARKAREGKEVSPSSSSRAAQTRPRCLRANGNEGGSPDTYRGSSKAISREKGRAALPAGAYVLRAASCTESCLFLLYIGVRAKCRPANSGETCACGAATENTEHVHLHCPLYANLRQPFLALLDAFMVRVNETQPRWYNATGFSFRQTGPYGPFEL